MQDTMTRQEELHSIYWDMYKDAYGVRPRGIDTSDWTEYAFQVEFEQLALTIEANETQRKESEARAISMFEARVANLMHTGTNRERVIAWIHEAEGTNGDDEFLCWTVGLPYRYFK